MLSIRLRCSFVVIANSFVRLGHAAARSGKANCSALAFHTQVKPVQLTPAVHVGAGPEHGVFLRDLLAHTLAVPIPPAGNALLELLFVGKIALLDRANVTRNVLLSSFRVRVDTCGTGDDMRRGGDRSRYGGCSSGDRRRIPLSLVLNGPERITADGRIVVIVKPFDLVFGCRCRSEDSHDLGLVPSAVAPFTLNGITSVEYDGFVRFLLLRSLLKKWMLFRVVFALGRAIALRKPSLKSFELLSQRRETGILLGEIIFNLLDQGLIRGIVWVLSESAFDYIKLVKRSVCVYVFGVAAGT